MPTGVYKRIKGVNFFPDKQCGRKGVTGIFKRTPEMYDSRRGLIPWNKGLTKETDERVKKYSTSHKGYKQTEETKRKLSQILTGRKLSEEHKEKIRLKCKGGNKTTFRIGFKHTEESKRKISLANKGIEKTKEWRERLSKSHQGYKHSEESKLKMSISHLGDKHCRWVNGNYKKRDIRTDGAYKYFVKQVRKRDGYKCKINNKDCKGIIEIHHILPWRDHPELRYEVNNGITLCQFHHPHKWSEEQRLIPIFQNLIIN